MQSRSHALSASPASSAAAELVSAVTEILATLNGEGEAQPIGHVLESLSQYAWSGITENSNDVLDRLHEVSVAVELLRGALVTPSGDHLVSDETVEFINRVTNAAHARYALDEGDSVTIEWLAALAGVTERTIRSATNSKNPNAIPITKDGHWTYIEAPHALKWLSGRSDFKPTQSPDHRPKAVTLANSLEVGEAWEKWREHRKVSTEELAHALGWSDEQTASYRLIEAKSPGEAYLALSPGFWRRLAEHFDSSQPEEVAALTYRRLAGAYAEWRINQSD